MGLETVGLFILIGAVIGFAGGLFAIGGALIAIPLLTAVFGFSQHASQGTAMLMALASAAVTMTIYARKGLLRIQDGLLMAASSVVMGFAASQLVRFVPDKSLQHGFGAFLVALAVIVWFVHLGETDEPRRLSVAAQIGVGSLAGTLSGFFVVGGALVSVPLLEYIGRYSQQRAQALVLLMLVPATAIGLVNYGMAGFVRWDVAVALAIGAVACAPLGTRVAIATQPRRLRRMFAVLQAAAGLLLLFGR